MSYETLDAIADSYTPLLLIISLILFALRFRRSNPVIYGLRLGLYTLCVYASQWVDKVLNLWSSIGLDYSTHTAAALALTILLIFQSSHFATRTLSLFIFFAYLLLMKIQNYHSFGDMLTTGFCIGLEILFIEVLISQFVSKKSKLNI